MVVKKFKARDKNYEIRLTLEDPNNIVVRAYYRGKPANGFCYNVTLETAHDLRVLRGQNAIKELINFAVDDVVQQRYEKLLAAIKASKK